MPKNVCDGGSCEPVIASAWQKAQQAAAAANDPCRFTSFVAWSVYDCKKAPAANPADCATGGS